MIIELLRVASTGHGTFGVLKADGVPFALTVERKWANNKRGESCIPNGIYVARRCRYSEEYHFTDSHRFGDTFVVEKVPGRKNILFHKGNVNDDSHGCIIIGEEFGLLNNKPAVLSSSKAFVEFKSITIGREIHSFEFVVKSFTGIERIM